MIKTHIAGVSYRPIECQVAAAGLAEGSELTLIPEPDNPYDPNAVKVYDDQGNHLGYVPRNVAATIVEDIDRIHARWDGAHMEIS